MPRRAENVATAKRDRRTAHRRGYDRQWRKQRLAFLQQHPLCRRCQTLGRIKPATVVDHIRRHSGQSDPLFWDRDNWQPLCKPCHDKKTAREQH